VAVGDGVSVGVMVAVAVMSGGRKGVSVMLAVAVIAPVVGLAVSIWNSASADACSLRTANPTTTSRVASSNQAAKAKINAGKVGVLWESDLHACKGLIDPVIIFIYAARQPVSKERDLFRQHQKQAAKNDDVDQDQ